MGGLPTCWARKTSRKLRTKPLGPQDRSRRPQERSKRLQDGPKPQDSSESAPRGLKTAPRALRGASRRPESAPGGFKTAPRALREASRRPEERSRRLKTAPRALQEAQDVPKRALGGFETTKQAFKLLKVGVSSRAPAHFLEVAQRASPSLLELFRHLRNQLNVTQSGLSKILSKKLCKSTQLKSARFCLAGSVHGHAQVHTSKYNIYIYILTYNIFCVWM